MDPPVLIPWRPHCSSAVLKYHISGDTNYFRIEEMSAVSEHVFAPFGNQKKGGLALFVCQKMSYKGSHTDPTLLTLKSLRDESEEAKAQPNAEDIGLASAKRESRISRERDSESVKKLRSMSEVKKGMSPEGELFMSVFAFKDFHSENPTPEEKRKYIAAAKLHLAAFFKKRGSDKWDEPLHYTLTNC